MRLILILSIITIPTLGVSQKSIDDVLSKTCDCLKGVSSIKDNKPLFDNEFGDCISQLYSDASSVDTIYNNLKKLNALIHDRLSITCKHYSSVDSMYSHYANLKNQNFILSATECAIMHNGTFMTKGDQDSTLIIMQDSIQLVKFNDGTYTKSSIKWDTPCSFILTRIESTNDYERQARKPGDETGIRIVAIKEMEVSYELDINGHTYSGVLLKLK